GKEQPAELRIGAGQRTVLQRARIERVAPGEPPSLVRQPQRGRRAGSRLEARGAVGANQQGPEATAKSDPVAGAEHRRLAAVVADHAYGAPGDDDPAHSLEHRGESRRRRREQTTAGAQLELEAPPR